MKQSKMPNKAVMLRQVLLVLAIYFTVNMGLYGFEFGLKTGYSRMGYRDKVEEDGSAHTLESKPIHGYVGAGLGFQISEKMKLRANALYDWRQYREPSTGFKATGNYLDIMLHPVLIVSGVELFAGPTLSTLVSQKQNQSGDVPKDDLNSFVPGVHAGLRFPAKFDNLPTVEVTYNRDLAPYSTSLGHKKYQDKLMLGLNYSLGTDDDFNDVYSHLYIETNPIWYSFGIVYGSGKVDKAVGVLHSLEVSQYITPVSLAARFDLSNEFIMPEYDVGVASRLMAGLKVGLPIGLGDDLRFEPYYYRSWGVVPIFAPYNDNPIDGIYQNSGWEAGFRIIILDRFSGSFLGFSYGRQNFHDNEKLGLYMLQIGLSLFD